MLATLAAASWVVFLAVLMYVVVEGLIEGMRRRGWDLPDWIARFLSPEDVRLTQ